MTVAYEIYALRYGTMKGRPISLNFLNPPDPHEAGSDLDYFVWLIRGHGRNILVDTGFTHAEAKERKRTLNIEPHDALDTFGIPPADIGDIVVTHLHYDHAGNLDKFPNARFHLQDREMAYATGRCMCHGGLRYPFSVNDVTLMVRHVYGERVTFHNGDGEIAPDVTVHHVGGHSDGLQVVRVNTARGPVVLASDAIQFLRQHPPQAAVSDRLQYRRHDGRAGRRSKGLPVIRTGSFRATIRWYATCIRVRATRSTRSRCMSRRSGRLRKGRACPRCCAARRAALLIRGHTKPPHLEWSRLCEAA